MHASKRQKSSGLDFESGASGDLRGLVSSLGIALDSDDLGGDWGMEGSAAAILAQTAEACLKGGGAGDACSAILSQMLQGLEAESGRLQAALDLHSLPDVPEYCRVEASVSNAKRAATYAHRLSYTTFAPPVVLGQNLFRPPAPQDFDFRASCLHNLARELQVKPATAAEAAPAVAQEPAVQPPEPPPSSTAAADSPLPESGATAVTQPAGPPEAAKEPQAAGFASSAFDFILNPDNEVAEEEFSSSEEESE